LGCLKKDDDDDDDDEEGFVSLESDKVTLFGGIQSSGNIPFFSSMETSIDGMESDGVINRIPTKNVRPHKTRNSAGGTFLERVILETRMARKNRRLGSFHGYVRQHAIFLIDMCIKKGYLPTVRRYIILLVALTSFSGVDARVT
jgi:hypothetical protein